MYKLILLGTLLFPLTGWSQDTMAVNLPVAKQNALVGEQMTRWEAYLNRMTDTAEKKHPTQIPLDEFIHFTLWRHHVVISDDAITFLYSADTSIRNRITVPINYPINFPTLPKVDSAVWAQFYAAGSNAQPPSLQTQETFLNSLDRLNKAIEKLPRDTEHWEKYNTSLFHLNAATVDLSRVDDGVVQRMILFMDELAHILSSPPLIRNNTYRINALLNGLEMFMQLQFGRTSYFQNNLEPNFTKAISGPHSEDESSVFAVKNLSASFKIVVYRIGKGGLEYNTPNLVQKYKVAFIEEGLYNSTKAGNKFFGTVFASIGLQQLYKGKYLIMAEPLLNPNKLLFVEHVDTLHEYRHGKNRLPGIPQPTILIKVD